MASRVRLSLLFLRRSAMLTRTLRGQLALQGLCPRGWKYAPKQCVWIERRKRVFFANCAGRTVCVGGGEKIWNSSGFCATDEGRVN